MLVSQYSNTTSASGNGRRMTDEDLLERLCPKCGGLVVREMWRGEVGERMWGVKCVNCGKRGEKGHWYGDANGEEV